MIEISEKNLEQSHSQPARRQSHVQSRTGRRRRARPRGGKPANQPPRHHPPSAVIPVRCVLGAPTRRDGYTPPGSGLCAPTCGRVAGPIAGRGPCGASRCRPPGHTWRCRLPCPLQERNIRRLKKERSVRTCSRKKEPRGLFSRAVPTPIARRVGSHGEISPRPPWPFA